MQLRQQGFTLIELMITVAIVGILAAIAYPSYQEYVRASRRADAQTVLLENAQFMERYYTTNGRYIDNAGNEPNLPVTESPKDGGTKFYDIGFQGEVTNTTYTLEAVPKGAMANDGCGTLTLAHTGAKSRTGTMPEDRCWRR
ncbi:type IV pilin protein [Allochromatium palmeri]|uniref:Prepilin-type N-terminal cleavage/methylation domain-containing protein n=1 Tax=Allochromatium palmeri TaxID=231048 RepID=A0A6N8EJ39_9GAMM|nr:type IV pilin protein [Allochromatium palmeri]MTW23048.1 prepilin-type N-terminal cleavage/methylation domain-containing protein [Allochromatium palmeri]